jgi:hypothetical protein
MLAGWLAGQSAKTDQQRVRLFFLDSSQLASRPASQPATSTPLPPKGSPRVQYKALLHY